MLHLRFLKHLLREEDSSRLVSRAPSVTISVWRISSLSFVVSPLFLSLCNIDSNFENFEISDSYPAHSSAYDAGVLTKAYRENAKVRTGVRNKRRRLMSALGIAFFTRTTHGCVIPGAKIRRGKFSCGINPTIHHRYVPDDA